MSDATALIAGAGPVGLTLAAELARLGVTARIVDKAPSRTELSKALVVWPRTLELLNLAGCADAFLAAGRPIRRARLWAGSRILAEIGFDDVETPYPFALFVPQSETERLLEEHLQSLGGRVERGVELLSFAAGPDGVTARLRDAQGRGESVACQYLIGCDGAHSVVRHGLGMEFTGFSEQGVWILGDLRFQAGAPDRLGLYWHAKGVLAIFPMKGDRCRVIADLGPAQSAPEEATLGLIQSLLDERGPGGLQACDPAWLSLFRINERKVKDYRRGRVFLAGDAAHIHSPAGGQGMNTGMQDAFNLAWKLNLVVNNIAGDALLATYAAERGEIGDVVLRNATNLTRVATIRNPVLQAARNAAALLLMKLPAFRRAFANVMTELAIAYPKSALSRGERKGRLKPGMRAPDAAFSGGRLFDELNRTGFTLLSVGAAGDAPAARFGDRVKTLAAPEAGEIAARYGEGLFVIRPDWYVGLVARAGDWAAAENYLAALAGGRPV